MEMRYKTLPKKLRIRYHKFLCDSIWSCKYIYYNLNKSAVQDHIYDKMERELKSMHKDYPKLTPTPNPEMTPGYPTDTNDSIIKIDLDVLNHYLKKVGAQPTT